MRAKAEFHLQCHVSVVVHGCMLVCVCVGGGCECAHACTYVVLRVVCMHKDTHSRAGQIRTSTTVHTVPSSPASSTQFASVFPPSHPVATRCLSSTPPMCARVAELLLRATALLPSPPHPSCAERDSNVGVQEKAAATCAQPQSEAPAFPSTALAPVVKTVTAT